MPVGISSGIRHLDPKRQPGCGDQADHVGFQERREATSVLGAVVEHEYLGDLPVPVRPGSAFPGPATRLHEPLGPADDFGEALVVDRSLERRDRGVCLILGARDPRVCRERAYAGAAPQVVELLLDDLGGEPACAVQCVGLTAWRGPADAEVAAEHDGEAELVFGAGLAVLVCVGFQWRLDALAGERAIEQNDVGLSHGASIPMPSPMSSSTRASTASTSASIAFSAWSRLS